MKKLGLIGGLGPASTPDYYLGIIDGYRRRTGDINYPEIIIYSVNMTETTGHAERGEWDEVALQISGAADSLARAGADFAAIASNTPHIVFGEISGRSPIPMISIVDETCKFAARAGYKRVLVIGTLFTMESGLYDVPLAEHGIAPLTPDGGDRKRIYSLFFPNLENGIVVPEDRTEMLKLVDQIAYDQRADSLLLGCTELPLMIKPGDVRVPVIDTTRVHIDSIVDHLINN